MIKKLLLKFLNWFEFDDEEIKHIKMRFYEYLNIK